MTATEATEMLSANEFTARLATLGFQATPAQLARWRRRGLMLPVKQQALGRGAGSVAMVCADEIGRAAAITELLSTRRNLADVRWQLWWRGYDIDAKYWRSDLSEAAALFDHVIAQISQALDADDDDALPGLIDGLYATPTNHKAFRQLRKRLGRQRFPAFIYEIARIAAGQFDDISANTDVNDAERRNSIKVVDVGLGLSRARTDRHDDVGPLLSGDYSSTLRALSDVFADLSFERALSAMTDDEMNSARAELFMLLSIIAKANTRLEAKFGKDAFGLRTIAVFFQTADSLVQAMMIIGWTLVRENPDIRGQTDDILRLQNQSATDPIAPLRQA